MKFKIEKMIPAQWSKLSRVRSIKLISSMYIWIFIVPIAAKLLSKIQDIVTVKIFEYTFQVPMSLPFSWKVFYYSALCFALANIIYSFRCPKLIKENPNYTTFRNEGRPEWHLSEYAEELEINFQEYKDNLVSNMDIHDGEVKTGEEFTHSLFWQLFWNADRYRPMSYWCTLVLYTFGFILIGYVVIQNMIWVTRHIVTL